MAKKIKDRFFDDYLSQRSKLKDPICHHKLRPNRCIVYIAFGLPGEKFRALSFTTLFGLLSISEEGHPKITCPHTRTDIKIETMCTIDSQRNIVKVSPEFVTYCENRTRLKTTSPERMTSVAVKSLLKQAIVYGDSQTALLALMHLSLQLDLPILPIKRLAIQLFSKEIRQLLPFRWVFLHQIAKETLDADAKSKALVRAYSCALETHMECFSDVGHFGIRVTREVELAMKKIFANILSEIESQREEKEKSNLVYIVLTVIKDAQLNLLYVYDTKVILEHRKILLEIYHSLKLIKIKRILELCFNANISLCDSDNKSLLNLILRLNLSSHEIRSIDFPIKDWLNYLCCLLPTATAEDAFLLLETSSNSVHQSEDRHLALKLSALDVFKKRVESSEAFKNIYAQGDDYSEKNYQELLPLCRVITNCLENSSTQSNDLDDYRAFFVSTLFDMLFFLVQKSPLTKASLYFKELTAISTLFGDSEEITTIVSSANSFLIKKQWEARLRERTSSCYPYPNVDKDNYFH